MEWSDSDAVIMTLNGVQAELNSALSDGTTIVIRALKDEDPNGEFAGSAYVFQLGE